MLQYGWTLKTCWWKKPGINGHIFCNCFPLKYLTHTVREQISSGQGSGRGMRSDHLMAKECPLAVMKMLWSYISVMVTQNCDYTECYWITHFKMTYFIWYEFFHNENEKKIWFLPCRSLLASEVDKYLQILFKLFHRQT